MNTNLYEFTYVIPGANSFRHTTAVIALTIQSAIDRFREEDEFKKESVIYKIEMKYEGAHV